MKKIFIGIIVSAVALIGYIAATSYTQQTPSEMAKFGPDISVEKTTINYDDIQLWSGKLPPGASYLVTLRPVATGTIFILGSGNADANGDANGSFLVARNLPTGETALRVEVASDSSVFDEEVFAITGIPPTITVTVANAQVNYGDMQSWEAKGLPRDTGYVLTIRSISSPVVVLLGSGNANTDGEASGSFLVEGNVPSGDNAFRIELASDPNVYNETFFVIGASPSVSVTLEKTQTSHDDTQNWSAKLPPNAGYRVTLRPVATATVIVIGSGTADANGDASGSFVVGGNLPSGDTVLRVELTSDPSIFDEKHFTIG